MVEQMQGLWARVNWETRAGPRVTGACSASEASVQHLWTEQHPTCYLTSAVYFSTEAPGLSCSLFPRSPRFMRKPPVSLSRLASSSLTFKALLYRSEVDLLPGTSSDPNTVPPASLNIVNLTPYPSSHWPTAKHTGVLL